MLSNEMYRYGIFIFVDQMDEYRISIIVIPKNHNLSTVEYVGPLVGW